MSKGKKRFGKKLREYRNSKKLTQCDLSRLSGVGHTTISYIESGNKSATQEQIEQLCGALDVPQDTIDELVRLHAKANLIPVWKSFKNN